MFYVEDGEVMLCHGCFRVKLLFVSEHTSVVTARYLLENITVACQDVDNTAFYPLV